MITTVDLILIRFYLWLDFASYNPKIAALHAAYTRICFIHAHVTFVSYLSQSVSHLEGGTQRLEVAKNSPHLNRFPMYVQIDSMDGRMSETNTPTPTT